MYRFATFVVDVSTLEMYNINPLDIIRHKSETVYSVDGTQ